MRESLFLFLCLVAIFGTFAQKKGFDVQYEWRSLEYYKTPEERQKAIDDGVFVPGNGFPIDIDVHYLRKFYKLIKNRRSVLMVLSNGV